MDDSQGRCDEADEEAKQDLEICLNDARDQNIETKIINKEACQELRL